MGGNQEREGFAGIHISGIGVEWRPSEGICSLEGFPVVMMWVDSALAGLMSGLQAMVGTERFLLALQSEGHKSVETDWQVMSQSPDFSAGFDAIANIAAVAGWGQWSLVSLDAEAREVRLRAVNSWESRYQSALGVCWGSGMVAGKFAGYCSKLFGTNCWAEQTSFIAAGDEYDEFLVRASSRSVETEIEDLLATGEATRTDMAVALSKLETEVAARMRAEATIRDTATRAQRQRDTAVAIATHEAMATGELTEGFALLTKAAVETLGAHWAEIWLLKEGTPLVERIVGYDEIEGVVFPRKPIEIDPGSAYMQALRSHGHVRVDDARTNPVTDDIKYEGIQSTGRIAALDAGIRVAGTLRGALCIDQEAQTRDWHPDEEAFAATLASLAGQMMVNAERRRAEELLRQSEERYSQILQTTPAIVVISRVADGMVLDLNRYAEFATGYLRKDVLGMTAAELNPWVAPTQRDSLVAALREHGEVQNREMVYRCRDGAVRTGMCSGRLISIDGEEAMLLVMQDITERKQAEAERIELERQLLHAQKLESLGVLAGGIAHDFNNLLMAILGNLDLAEQMLSPASTARQNIRQAAQATRRATDLTRQLLAYSGRGRFVVAPMDLNELVEENAQLFRAAVARTLTIQLDLSEDPLRIEADAGQVQQVIMNLITNASEAIGDGPGTITLTTGVICCDADYLSRSRAEEKPAPGEFVFVEVADTGHGMDEEMLQRIFDPFFTTRFTGRGLGMSAVLGIVRGHQGAIIVDSTPGSGTLVRVLFPPCAVDEGAAASGLAATAAPNASASHSGTVLVVDDDEIVRKLCVDYVTLLGYEAIPAGDGEEGVRTLQRQDGQIVCVLLDLMMPRMDGVTAFREMKRIAPEVPVILCSGYNEQDATERFVGEGLAGFLQKPYRLRELQEMMDRVVQG